MTQFKEEAMPSRLSLLAAACSIILLAGCGILPPATPEEPTGPSTGDVGVSYRFTAASNDPQNLPLRYQFVWGDEQRTEWTRYYASGEPVTLAHTWDRAGAFRIRVRAQNLSGRESEFSPAHAILIGGESGYPDQIIARIPVGYAPFGICILPSGEYVYVANRVGGISVISTETKTVIHTISTSDEPAFVAPTPDGQHVYFTMSYANQVGIIRTSDNTIVTRISVPGSPHGIAVSPDGSRAYTANYYGGTASVINTTTNEVLTNVAIPGEPWCVEVTPDGEYVYASGRDTDTLAVIRTSDNQVVARVAVGREPGDIAFSPDGAYAYLSCRLDNDVAVVRTSDLEVVARIPGCSHPTGIALLADGSYAYLSNYHGDNVLIARTSDNTVVGTLRFGTITDFSVTDPNRDEVYIGCPNEDEIRVVGYGR
jgi:YVTN family beta-propeller protein